MPWSRPIADRARALEEALAKHLENASPDAFEHAVARAGVDRLTRFMTAVQAYRRHPYRRTLADPPVLWREGATRLFDYGALHGSEEGRPVLVVPSLINRAYVLDLAPGRSLVRFLAERGFRPLLVDWGTPGAAEEPLDLDGYIAGRLARVLDAVLDASGNERPALVGYCMGGLLTLALAGLRPDDVSGLALLATPWDFHADGGAQARAIAAVMAPMQPLFEAAGMIPVDVLQTLFASLDPCLALRKFLAFDRMAPDSEKAEIFVALEDWLNDGVSLPAHVGRDCLMGWYGENRPGTGAWTIAGQAVRPDAFDRPTIVVVPHNDRIVPPASALALAEAIPQAECLRPRAGHIGMVVGSAARRSLWEPLADWLNRLEPDRMARGSLAR